MESEQVHREDPLRLGLLAMLSPGIAWADDSHIFGAVREVLGSRAEAIRLAALRLDDKRASDARRQATRDELAALRTGLCDALGGGNWSDADMIEAVRDAERERDPAAAALRLSLVAALPSIQGWTPTDADIVAEVAGLVDAVRSVAADADAETDGLDALLEAMGTTEEMTIGQAAEQVRLHLRTVDRYHALRAKLVDAIGERYSARDPDIVARVQWLVTRTARVALADTWRATAEEMGDESREAHELLTLAGVPWGDDDDVGLLPRIAWLVGSRAALRGGV